MLKSIQILCIVILLFTSIAFGQLEDATPIHAVLPNKDGTKVLLKERLWNKLTKKFIYSISLTDIKTGKNVLIADFVEESSPVLWGMGEQSVIFTKKTATNRSQISKVQVVEKSFLTHRETVLTVADNSIIQIAMNKNGSKIAFVVSTSSDSNTIQFPESKLLLIDTHTKKIKSYTDKIKESIGENLVWIDENTLGLLLYSGHSTLISPSKIAELNVVDDKVKEIYNKKTFLKTLVASGDGQFLAFVSDEEDKFSITSKRPKVSQFGKILLYDRKAGKESVLPETMDASPQLLDFSFDSKQIFFMESYQSSIRLQSLKIFDNPIGLQQYNPEKEASIYFPKMNPSKNWIGYIEETAKEPPVIWILDKDFKEKKLVVSPVRVPAKNLGFVTEKDFVWKAKDGLNAHGLLDVPSSKKNLPLIVIPHGGPTTQSSYQYLGFSYQHGVPFDLSHFLEKGAVVFRPNFRGSTGFGADFRVANLKEWGAADWGDIEAGIDALVQQEIVDPKRIAIAGWSYGGYLCAYGATHTERFQAAACGAAFTDLLSHALTSVFPQYVPGYFGVDPKEISSISELLIKRSPAFSTQKTGAPLLLVHGKNDKPVHFSQALELQRWATLRSVPVKLIELENEGHGITNLEIIQEVAEEINKWIMQSLGL